MDSSNVTDLDLADEDEYEEKEVVDLKKLRKDMETIAKHHINRFFLNQEFHCGGPIPEVYLKNQAYIDMVLDVDVESGVAKVYSLIGSDISNIDDEDDDDEVGNVDQDTEMVLMVHHECARLEIPKCFRSGITLMYLELCRGIEIPNAFSLYGR